MVLSAGPVQPHLAPVRQGEHLPGVLDVGDQEAPHHGGDQGLDPGLPAPECGAVFLCEGGQREEKSGEKYQQRESYRQYLLMKPGVRSAVEDWNLDHLQSVVGVEQC